MWKRKISLGIMHTGKFPSWLIYVENAIACWTMQRNTYEDPVSALVFSNITSIVRSFWPGSSLSSPCSAWKLGIFAIGEFCHSNHGVRWMHSSIITNPLDGAMEPANWRWPKVASMYIPYCGCKRSCFYLGLANKEPLILHATVIHGKQIWSLRRDQKGWRSRSGHGLVWGTRVGLVVVCDYW